MSTDLEFYIDAKNKNSNFMYLCNIMVRRQLLVAIFWVKSAGKTDSLLARFLLQIKMVELETVTTCHQPKITETLVKRIVPIGPPQV